jgi:hypothetical protein
MIAVRIGGDAEVEIAEAMAWYSHQRAGLGSEFLQDLETALERIAVSPLARQIFYRKARKTRMDRFPYYILYAVAADAAVVVCVVHVSRDPRFVRRAIRQRT